MITNSVFSYGYRSGGGAGSHYHGEHRPTSAYIPRSSYRSRYEVDSGGPDNYTSSHLRSFYDDRATTPNSEFAHGAHSNLSAYTPSTAAAVAAASHIPPDSPGSTNTTKDGGGLLSRFRPVTRRLGSALRDVDGRRARARSQSNDHMYSTREDIDYSGNYNS